MPKPSPVRKEKKTFSFSRQAVMYLEALRKERRSRSVSSVLEEIIRQQQQAREMKSISASVSSYYDSLTDQQVEEDRAWGQFASTQFPAGGNLVRQTAYRSSGQNRVAGRNCFS
jgi:hypothetical protein